MVGLRIRIAALICISIGFACQPPPRPAHPNILFIMADDLGYGDVYAFNPGSSIPTPHIDRLASQGLSFTNAHAPASVCTPTRYSLLTGRYSWRSNRKKGVTWVWEGPMIDSGRYTIGTMLQTAGYHTACIGKWHLGLDWPTRDGLPASLENQGKNVDYSSPIKNGPTERGFDYYFGQEVPSFPPHAFIENERVTVEPSEWLQAGEGGIPGAKAPGWRYEDLMYRITDKSIGYIRERTLRHPDRPFFLYLALSAPHTPIAPHENFQGKTQMGRYGDYVFEMDHHVGHVLDLLDSLGISENTLVFFSSDNGGVNMDGLPYSSPVGELVKNQGHNSNGDLRGMKSDAWEGGHRIPFIARWPGKIPAGAVSDALVSQVDMMATFSALTGVRLPEQAGEDSYNILPLLTGASEKVRPALVTQSGEGILSIQDKDWKLILCEGGGGKWTTPGGLPQLDSAGGSPVWKNVQLYRIGSDRREETDLADQYPEKVRELMNLLKEYILGGRSTPGNPLPTGRAPLWREVEWVRQIE